VNGETLRQRLKLNVRWDTPEAVGQVSWALGVGKLQPACRFNPVNLDTQTEAHDEDGVVVATRARLFRGNFLPRHDITHSRELRRRELQGGENEVTAIQRELNGNSDGD
jgi:hypothetical protein